MTVNTGATAGEEPQSLQPQPRHAGTDLDARYGAIGIVAVAAAVRYARAGADAVRQSAAPWIEQRFIEQAS